MNPWKTFSSGTLYHGNCLKVLKQLPAKSVQLAITSPPYFGLRSYEGTAVWIGGDAPCDHVEALVRTRGDLAKWSVANAAGGGHAVPSPLQYKDVCGKCGAKRVDEQIGLETVPDCARWQIPVELRDKYPELQPCRKCFVCAMVLVGRRVRHVLRDDGIYVLNLGDSYCTVPHGPKGHNSRDDKFGSDARTAQGTQANRKPIAGLQHKDLIGIPWRCAFALQADGWILRSDVPWVKRTAMPESSTDRPAKALEYIFIFVKEPKYYWDVNAVRTDTRNMRNADLWFQSVDSPHGLVGMEDELLGLDVTNEPLAIKHFAAFPSRLPEPFIKAATSQHGCCPTCGTCWRRVVKKEAKKRDRPNQFTKREGKKGTGNVCANDVVGVTVETLGWEPGCGCPDNKPVPCKILEPFCGTGTTAVVAQRLGRHFVGIDLSEDYLAMAAKRIQSRGEYGKTKITETKRKGFFQ